MGGSNLGRTGITGQASSPKDNSFFSGFFAFFLEAFLSSEVPSRPSPTAFRFSDFDLMPSLDANDKPWDWFRDLESLLDSLDCALLEVPAAASGNGDNPLAE